MSLVITSGFPRDLPERADGTLPFEAASFEPVYNQTIRSTRGGTMQVANLGVSRWGISYATHIMPHEDCLDMVAWLQSLRGGALLFKAWHPFCRYPVNYPNGFAGINRAGGGAFDGTVTVTAIASTRDTVTASGLPAGFVLKRGDMISIPMGSSRTLHRLIAASTANGSGVAVLTVEPTLPLSVVTDVTATLVKPWCLAVVDASSIRAPLQPGRMGRVEFSAMQTF